MFKPRRDVVDLGTENAYYAVPFRFRQPPDARRFQCLKEADLIL